MEFALFPLHAVHYPGLPVRLHVFEERYRDLIRECLEEDVTFGTLLIVRGSEVGTHVEIAPVGTEVSIVAHQALPDGRYLVAGVGERRFRVLERLPDKPYPRATVDFMREGRDAADADVLERRRVQVERGVRAYLRLLGTAQDELDGLDMAAEPWLASYEVAALLRVDQHEKQAMLEAPTVADRLRLESRTLTREIALLEHLRRHGPPAQG